jgi:hypothetical protein
MAAKKPAPYPVIPGSYCKLTAAVSYHPDRGTTVSVYWSPTGDRPRGSQPPLYELVSHDRVVSSLEECGEALNAALGVLWSMVQELRRAEAP